MPIAAVIPAIAGFAGTAAGAATISAGIGAVGSIYAGSQANKQANKQLAAQQNATNASLAAQQAAFQQQQQNLAPYLQAGYGALGQLQQQLGITPTAAPGGGAAGGQPDYQAYLAANPDVAADAAKIARERGDVNGDGQINDIDGGAWHYANYGQGEGRALPTTAPTAPQAATGTPAPTGAPTFAPRDTYTRPEVGPAPTMPDLSAAAYQKSPGYEVGLKEGQRNLNANFGARGLLGSGAGAEAAIKFGSDYQDKDYTDWRNAQMAQYQVALNQYNQDRARTDNVFGQDRGFGTGVYDADRAYGTQRYDQQNSNLFNLAQLGNPSQSNALLQSNANNTSGLLQTGANNLSGIYGQQAQNAGGLAGNLVGIGQGLLGNLFGSNTGGVFNQSSNPILNWSQGWGGAS